MKKLLSITLAIIFIAGCASCNKTSNNNSNTDENKVFLKKPVEPGLSTGTILLKATLLKKKTNKAFNTLQLKVNKILDYGHSTPAIATGEKINVIVKNEKLKNRLSVGKPINVLLKHSVQKVGKETPIEWILINIK